MGDQLRAFASRQEFRDWLRQNHRSTAELLVRCYKVHAADKGLTYREALDEALCFGAAGNQRTSTFWVMEARREETRERRLAELIARSAKGEPIKPLDRR